MALSSQMKSKAGVCLRSAATALVAIVALASGAEAQTCVATAPSNAPTCATNLNAVAAVGHILQLTVTGGAQTTLQVPATAQYDSSAVAGTADQYPYGATGPVLTVKANRGWNLTIKALNAYFTFAPDATYGLCRGAGGGTAPTCTGSSSAGSGKISTDLAFSLNATTAFAGLSTTALPVSSNATGSSATYTIYFRTKWLYGTDVPGTYTLPVVYTVTGQ